MRRRLKNRLMIGVAVVAVLAGLTTAVVMAAQPASHHRKGGALATAAAYLGVSPAQLTDELRSGKSLAEIADATGRKSEAGLVEALESAAKEKLAVATASLPSRVKAEVDRVGLPAGGRAGWRLGGRGRALSAAAGYLGVSTSQLRADLRSGKTLAQVADATAGKSHTGLIEALVASRKATLASRVKAGTITQAQANLALPHLLARVTAQVDHVHAQHRSRASAGAP